MTTGAAIVADLLRADANLKVAVAPASIKLGRLPDGVALPALLVRTISSVDRQPLRRGAKRHTTDRVAVTVRAASYRDQVAIVRLLRTACGGVVVDVVDVGRVAIAAAGTGPDVAGPADSFEQTQDFRVSFDADA